MILLPAIDLFEGKAVRLLRGDYTQMTVYGDPLELAEVFVSVGAEYLHMVDLEGAKSGETPNFGLVSKIAQTSGLKVEIGGGVRSEETIRRYLEAGVTRVILGTIAATDLDFTARMVRRYGEAIAVGVDLNDRLVAVKGWTETSGLSGLAFCKSLEEIGVQTVICTDIQKDGAMNGTNRALYQTLSASFSMRFIASGGVSSMEDILALKELNLYGAIVGKAYYTGAIDLKAAILAAKSEA
ncbi:MAG: 1-(5-phosphoribosyl)-5-[(5-phosphoribosylamino)methylideneamino]imidazole-4-carboxamide isomerase [Clostridiaceae bacterium]